MGINRNTQASLLVLWGGNAASRAGEPAGNRADSYGARVAGVALHGP